MCFLLMHAHNLPQYRIVGNFRWRKHEFHNFTATRESFLHKLLGRPYPLCNQFNILRKFSPRNAPFLLIRESFLPRKFPAIRYHTGQQAHAHIPIAWTTDHDCSWAPGIYWSYWLESWACRFSSLCN